MQLTRPATFAKLWPRIRRKGVTRMSILVAVKKNDRVAIAADTMHSTGSRREHADNLVGRSKLRRVGRSVLGGVGWSVYDNILEHYLNRYKRPPSFRDERAVFTFFLKFWKTLKDKYQVVNDQPDRDDRTPFCDLDSEFIVASPRTIYQISSDLTVMQFDKYVAIGSGRALCLRGAARPLRLAAQRRSDRPPSHRGRRPLRPVLRWQGRGVQAVAK
jgi:ATP-dependent protease HslVU (ClpYQ) peptidase subunit